MIISPILFLLILFFLTELILRATFPDLRYFYQSKKVTGGIPFSLNSLGFRDHDFSMKKRPGEYRILCTGDSTTFGLSVRLEETWPKQLEQNLRQRVGDRITVVNGGGAGFQPHQIKKLYHDKLRNFEMDLFILGFCLNDVVLFSEKTDQEKVMEAAQKTGWQKAKNKTESLRASLSRFYTFAFLQYVVKKLDSTEKKSDYILREAPEWFNAFGWTAESDVAWQDTLNSLRRLRDDLASQNIRLVIVPIPYRFLLSDDPRDDKQQFKSRPYRIHPIQKLQSFSTKFGIRLVPSLQALQAERRLMLQGIKKYDPLYIDITDDYCHPDARGYAIISQAILESVLPILNAPH